MKILIASTFYYPNINGGAEKSTQGLAEALVDRGHEVAVVTLNPRRRRESSEVNGVRVHYLPLWNIYFPGRRIRRSTAVKVLWHALDTYNPLMAASLGNVLDAERPDLVNTHYIGGFSVSTWGAAKRRGLPLVHTARGVDHLCPRGMLREGKLCPKLCGTCRVSARPRIFFSGGVDVLTAVSQYVIDEYDRHGGFPNADKLVVHNACRMASGTGTLSRNHNGALRFGFLGRFHPTKGPDRLVRSFLELPEGKAELVLAGRGIPSYEDQLKGLAEGHPGIRWLGFVAPESAFQQIDVMVVPSLWNDPAPRTVMESMAYGIPVIGSRRGGIPELMGKGTGWLYEPDEPGALRRALQAAIDSRDDLAKMSRRASEQAAKFSTEAMVNGYLDAYALAIEKNSRASSMRRSTVAARHRH